MVRVAGTVPVEEFGQHVPDGSDPSAADLEPGNPVVIPVEGGKLAFHVVPPFGFEAGCRE